MESKIPDSREKIVVLKNIEIRKYIKICYKYIKIYIDSGGTRGNLGNRREL